MKTAEREMRDLLNEAPQFFSHHEFDGEKLKWIQRMNAALAQPPAPEQQAPQEEAATIRTWHKNGNQHAELMDWGAALDNLPDGLHKVYLPPAAPEAAKAETELAARLLAHAAAHSSVSPYDQEQQDWENDLRQAAALLAADTRPQQQAKPLTLAQAERLIAALDQSDGGYEEARKFILSLGGIGKDQA